MTRTATVTLTADDIAAIESMLNLAGAYLINRINEHDPLVQEALSRKIGLYYQTCKQFGVLPLNMIGD